MDYVKPEQVVANIAIAGAKKSNTSVSNILIKGALSGSLLGFSTVLAYIVAIQTGMV